MEFVFPSNFNYLLVNSGEIFLSYYFFLHSLYLFFKFTNQFAVSENLVFLVAQLDLAAAEFWKKNFISNSYVNRVVLFTGSVCDHNSGVYFSSCAFWDDETRSGFSDSLGFLDENSVEKWDETSECFGGHF